MLKKFKGVLIGILIGAMLSGTVAVAANTTTLYNVLANGIRIVIDGKELHPTDVNGNKVEPMIYNGTTYLPVRAVAGAIGKAVYWDGPNYTVYLGDMDGKLEYPTVMLKDMTSLAYSVHPTSQLTDNYGHRYNSAIDNYSSFRYEYLLNMKYSRFKGTLFVPEGVVPSELLYLTIEADGRILYTSPQMDKASAPIEIDVDVTGYNDVVIEFSNYWNRNCPEHQLCLADAGFYQ